MCMQRQKKEEARGGTVPGISQEEEQSDLGSSPMCIAAAEAGSNGGRNAATPGPATGETGGSSWRICREISSSGAVEVDSMACGWTKITR